MKIELPRMALHLFFVTIMYNAQWTLVVLLEYLPEDYS